jgi:hypothetical protein
VELLAGQGIRDPARECAPETAIALLLLLDVLNQGMKVSD